MINYIPRLRIHDVIVGFIYLAPCYSLTLSSAELHRPNVVKRHSTGAMVVLCQSSASLFVIDGKTNHATKFAIDGLHTTHSKLADMAILDDEHLVIVDSKLGELLVVKLNVSDVVSNSIPIVGRAKIGHSPANVLVNEKLAFVSSLWDRRWFVVDLSEPRDPKVCHSVDLSFSPRHQIQLNPNTILAIDGFCGRWATIDIGTGRVVRIGEFTGAHNMSGIAFDPARTHLLIPHMTLNAEKPTTQFNVHWGDVILNVVRKVSLEELLSETEITDSFYYLGRPDTAAGDPTGIVVTQSERQLVCFSGTSEVGISDPGGNSFDRVAVGRRPVGMETSADESLLFVASQLDDSIAVIDVETRKLKTTIRLSEDAHSKSLALTTLQLGEQLFFDSTLSSDGWFSCHSCHTDCHSNGGLADTFGDGTTGDAKRVPSLLGVSDTGPWAWNGSMNTLKNQIHKSVRTTMRGEEISDEHAAAIEAFICSQMPAPSVVQARSQLNSERFARGRQVFASSGCVDCHEPPSYTSADAYDVGFTDRTGNSTFNPPSLRGVSQRRRLLHDNRAASVHDVLQRLGHQGADGLSPAELKDLV
ncbi:MAG: hypothetical protein KDB27_26960, partial [Planctomycetales bacterium]|nr:hypothetical protein [Planctomycetales bacterium]